MKRRFEIEINHYGEYIDSAIIELDQEVIDVVDDEWRSYLYDLKTPEEIAEHIAFNLIQNEISLTQMDGWADLSNDMAKIIKYPDFCYEYNATEIVITK